tara:strand:- start:114 stop:467 length:354 start_codon:yes stop_codon:yes gene_type:complete
MANNIYGVGLHNVGSYQVAGKPYLSASLIEEETKEFSFPNVTKKIIIENTGSASVYFHFINSPSSKFELPSTKKIEIDVKCVSLYVSGSTQSGIQLYSELTNIPKNRMYSLIGLEGV